MDGPPKTHAYLYLIREREFASLDQPVFKLGMTVQFAGLRFGRLDAYKKGSEAYLVIRCPLDAVCALEQEAKRRFRAAFDRHADGSEYFAGDHVQMVRILTGLANDAWDAELLGQQVRRFVEATLVRDDDCNADFAALLAEWGRFSTRPTQTQELRGQLEGLLGAPRAGVHSPGKLHFPGWRLVVGAPEVAPELTTVAVQAEVQDEVERFVRCELVRDAGACVTLAELRVAWQELGVALPLRDLKARLTVALGTACKENSRFGGVIRNNFFTGWRLAGEEPPEDAVRDEVA